MPELPEVETTRRGIAPHVLNKPIVQVVVRQPRLRWEIPGNIQSRFKNQQFVRIDRRAKYLLLKTANDCMIIHLGMSGSLRVVNKDQAPEKHDHIDVVFNDDTCLRLRDPRRFGAVLATDQDPTHHKLLAQLGVEPLDDDLDGEYLFKLSRKRQTAIKNFIMDSHIVVGVGNIYASEALYLAGIHPLRKAGSISRERFKRLCECIKQVLRAAIDAGGTSLRDFVDHRGQPGYFAFNLHVYGRAGQPCPACGKAITSRSIGQRNSFYCTHCQK